MNRLEVIFKAEELKDLCGTAVSCNYDLYLQLLDDYTVHVWALKSINDSYIWEQVLVMQERLEDLDGQLTAGLIPSDETVRNEYQVLVDMLAILLDYPGDESS